MRQKGKNSVREKKTFDDRVSSMLVLLIVALGFWKKQEGKPPLL